MTERAQGRVGSTVAPDSVRAKVAIITGASSGIGKATALVLAGQGYDLALAGRNLAALEEVGRAIIERGRQTLVVPTDVTDREQVQRLVDQTLARWGRVDVLVASAGIYVRGPFTSLTPAEFERSLATNFYGALYAVQAVLPAMLSQHEGHIVLVSSMDGKKGLVLDAPYVAAKFALAGVGEVLRQELHGTGVFVTTVFPARVDTPMIADLQVPALSAKVSPEVVARAIARGIQRRQPEVIVPFRARLLWYVNTLSPRLGDWVARKLRLEGRYDH